MAATKGNMTLRMEPELKAQAAALFKSLGMDLSTATGIFYRQALRCQKRTRICMAPLIAWRK